MKRLIAFISALVSGLSFSSDFTANPDSLVQQFIADYREWNDKAMSFDRKFGSEQGMKQAEAAYTELLKKYCLPSFKGQPIAFGTESNHSPKRESIVSSHVSNHAAVIRTKSKSSVVSGFEADYEYHLIYQSGRWYLTEVYYVDHEGKYPGL